MGSKDKTIFSEEGHDAYQIKRKEVKKIMQVQVKCNLLLTPDLLVWVKSSDIDIVQISIF